MVNRRVRRFSPRRVRTPWGCLYASRTGRLRLAIRELRLNTSPHGLVLSFARATSHNSESRTRDHSCTPSTDCWCLRSKSGKFLSHGLPFLTRFPPRQRGWLRAPWGGRSMAALEQSSRQRAALSLGCSYFSFHVTLKMCALNSLNGASVADFWTRHCWNLDPALRACWNLFFFILVLQSH